MGQQDIIKVDDVFRLRKLSSQIHRLTIKKYNLTFSENATLHIL